MIRIGSRDTSIVVKVPVVTFIRMSAIGGIVTSTQATGMVGNAVAIVENAALGLRITIGGTVATHLL